MFQHIDSASLREFKEGKHTCIEITITAKNGVFTTLMDDVINEIDEKAGLPLLTNDKLGIAAKNHIHRTEKAEVE